MISIKLYDKLMSNMALIAFLNLAFPFIKVKMFIEVSRSKYYTYDIEYSPVDVLFNGIENFHIDGINSTNLKQIFYVVVVLVIIEAFQLAAYKLKNAKIIIFTAVTLLSIALSFLYLAVKNDVGIKFGFYSFITIQILLITIVAIPKKQNQTQ